MKFAVFLLVFVFALIIAGYDIAKAQSTLIIIHTANTVREGVYQISLESRNDTFEDEESLWLIKAKWGFRRSEAGVAFDRDQDNEYRLYFNAKYSIPFGRCDDTALAFGIQALGINNTWIAYSVVSRKIDEAGLHLGIVYTDDELGWFTGANYFVTPRLDLMADYTNSDEIEWSVGFEYNLAEHWNIKSGVRFESDATLAVIEIKYIGSWK